MPNALKTLYVFNAFPIVGPDLSIYLGVMYFGPGYLIKKIKNTPGTYYLLNILVWGWVWEQQVIS